MLDEVLGPSRAPGVEGAIEHPAGVFVDEQYLAAGIVDAGSHHTGRRHRAGAEWPARIHPAVGAEIHSLLFTQQAGARTAVNVVSLLERGDVGATGLAHHVWENGAALGVEAE